jgi:TonB-dependent starch-binding outer membrane protein SusC
MIKKICLSNYCTNNYLLKFFITMKLTLLLTCITALQISASVYSQNTKISLKGAQGNFGEIITAIEDQTDFKVFYKNEQIDLTRKVQLSASSASVADLLTQALEGTNLVYTLLDKIIVLSPKEVNAKQQITVKGKVVDEKGISMPGVNVVEKGTTNGGVTDMDGNFTLNVASTQSVLVISFVGYTPIEMVVGTQTNIAVTMVPDLMKLDEVVVVGYGVQKKKLVTGATTQVKNEDLVKNHAVRIENALQGITPGMTIIKQSGQPGSDFNISIRGLSSINGNGPLVLIDGVPGSLNTLNPSDVESVDVLKDAASAAIYGSRAANGVVLITTKKGKAGEMQISYDYSYGVSNAAKKIPMLNSKEYAVIMNEEAANSGTQPYFFTQAQIDAMGNGTDWQEAAYNKNAPTESHYLGISGGNEKSVYSLSVSYNNEEGIFNMENKSKYTRLGFRANSEHKVKKYLKIGENFTYTHRNQKGLGVGNVYNNFLRDILNASPLIETYDVNNADGFGRSTFNADQMNPIASMHFNYNGVNKYDDIIGNIYAELEIIKGLKYRTDFGATLNFSDYSNHSDIFELTPSTYNSEVTTSQSMSRYFSYTYNNIVSYEKQFNKHDVLVMAGMEVQDSRYSNLSGRADGTYQNGIPVLSNVVIPDTAILSGDFGSGDSRISYFGRLSYNYDEKYMFTASIRRDGSSRFGKNNRWGVFPAFSVGWAISKEGFMASTASWLNYLKLRASWGQNGKEPYDQYIFLARVGNSNRYYTFNSKQIGISPIISANPSLKWEASQQTNIGFDAKVLDNFNLSVDYYNKTSKNWIMQSTVPGVSGIAGISDSSNPFINGGNVTNSGIEIELGYSKNIGDLSLDIKANFAYNKNKVTSVPGKFINGATNVLYNGSPTIYRISENNPMGYFYGYKTAGIFQTQNEIDNYIGSNGKPLQSGAKPGDVKFQNLNGDSLIDDNDKTKIGDPNPDFIYGFNIAASYKGFDLSINLQGMAGNQVVECYRDEGRYYNNYSTDILNRWTGPGTSNTIPRVTLGDEANQNYTKFNDLYVHDAGFLKVKSINIGYDLKKSILKNTPVQQLRIYFSAINLFTFTKYKGLDPEVGYADGQDRYASGVDLGFYPSARTFMVGVNVKF